MRSSPCPQYLSAEKVLEWGSHQTWKKAANIGLLLGFGLVLPTLVFPSYSMFVIGSIVGGIVLCVSAVALKIFNAKLTKLASKESIDSKHAVRSLVEEYFRCWDSTQKVFDDKKSIMPFNELFFLRVLWKYVQRYMEKHHPEIPKNPKKIKIPTDPQMYGYIEKVELPVGSAFYVRADLHGDLWSLIVHLQKLQKMGLLDEHFRCKKRAHLVFLGDYMDRGKYSLQVLELLALLKYENWDQVHLVRGNHEYIHMNRSHGGEALNDFLKVKSNESALSNFYNSLPLTTYITVVSSRLKPHKKQFIHGTHGTLEVHVDADALLKSDKSYDRMQVPRKRELSKRLVAIVEEVQKSGKTVEELGKELRVLREDILNSPDGIFKVIAQFLEGEDSARIQELRKENRDQILKTLMQISACRVKQLVDEHAPFPETAYNWGDLTRFDSAQQDYRATQQDDCNRDTGLWMLSPTDLKHCFRCSSSNPRTHSVVMMLRGHEHDYFPVLYPLKNERKCRVLAVTLPIGRDTDQQYLERVTDPDMAYVVLLKDVKLENCIKIPFLREQGSSEVTFVPPVSLRGLEDRSQVLKGEPFFKS